MATKADPGEFDCYENAEDDEPMFVLLARDPMASALVRLWARAYEQRHHADLNKAERKHAEALNCADAMDRWKEDHPDH